MRIAHISDLHLSAKHKRMNIRNTKRLLEYIQRLKVDHVVVTGDIAASGEKEDFVLARNLFQAAGLYDASTMSVVIGNHDVFGGVHTPEEILEFPRRCRKVDVRKGTELFHEHFQPLFHGACLPGGATPFPFFKSLRGTLLIGLNSVTSYAPTKNPVGSNGLVDERQQELFDQMLSSGRFKDHRIIVLVHHHFSKMHNGNGGTVQSVWKAFEQQTMKLRGKKRLMQLFKKHRVEAVLHGHYHENMKYVRKGLLFINGGGSILGPSPSVLHVNVLHVTSMGIDVERHEFPAVEHLPRIRIPGREPVLLPSHSAA